MKPSRPSSMTAAKRAGLDAGSTASSPPTSLTALLGGAYRLLDSVAMVAPCAGGEHMITRWREAAATNLKSCARPHSRRTRFGHRGAADLHAEAPLNSSYDLRVTAGATRPGAALLWFCLSAISTLLNKIIVNRFSERQSAR